MLFTSEKTFLPFEHLKSNVTSEVVQTNCLSLLHPLLKNNSPLFGHTSHSGSFILFFNTEEPRFDDLIPHLDRRVIILQPTVNGVFEETGSFDWLANRRRASIFIDCSKSFDATRHSLSSIINTLGRKLYGKKPETVANPTESLRSMASFEGRETRFCAYHFEFPSSRSS